MGSKRKGAAEPRGAGPRGKEEGFALREEKGRPEVQVRRVEDRTLRGASARGLLFLCDPGREAWASHASPASLGTMGWGWGASSFPFSPEDHYGLISLFAASFTHRDFWLSWINCFVPKEAILIFKAGPPSLPDEWLSPFR